MINTIFVWFSEIINYFMEDWPVLMLQAKQVTDITEAIVGIATLLANVSWIIPIADIGICLFLLVSLRILMTGGFTVNWLIKRIRGG